MVNAGERSSNETSEESEGALMVKRVATKGNSKDYKRDTNAQHAAGEHERRMENPDELRTRWAMEGIPVLIAKDFLEPENPESVPLAALEGRASRDIEELARQIHRCCSDKKWTSYQKRVACEQLVKLALLSTNSIYGLAKDFPEPFREIAEEMPYFPCLFPAHAEDVPSVKKVIWNKFNLGKRHTLKLRAAPGRKTFSKKTPVNKLLIDFIELVHELARRENDRDPGLDYVSTLRHVAHYVPLTPDPKNARQWLDVIWELLLIVIPEPEKHPQLRNLGQHPSRTERAHFGERKIIGIKEALRANRKTAGYVRAAIKEALGKYLVRMLRKEQSDK
jgi:hypothetical protein